MFNIVSKYINKMYKHKYYYEMPNTYNIQVNFLELTLKFNFLLCYTIGTL